MLQRLVRTAAHSAFAAVDLALSRRQGPRILIYHQIGSGLLHEMNLLTEVFLRQIDWLEANRKVVSLEEVVARRGETGASDLVTLTFDDGYADIYRNAFPILQERAIPFTLYLTTGPTEDPQGFPDWPGEPISWNQVEEMLRSGLMTLGAHTHTHPDLRQVDEQTAISEIAESNRLIEQRLGVTPRHFTYTKGWWSPTADPIVRRGYDTATLGMGEAITADSDLHTLSRVAVNQSEPFWAWRRKLSTGGRAENWARRRLHRYDGP